MNKFKIILNFGLIAFVYFFTSPFLFYAQAETMSNDSYIIKMQGFNAASGTIVNTDYELRSAFGGQTQSTSEGTDYKVKTGINNLASSGPFSITLSSNLVNFGILSPTNPIVRTVDLTTSSLTAYGYSVLIFENRPLTASSSANNALIPDTTCDNGACNAQNASEWKNTLSYGFGYRCDNLIGIDCDSSFVNVNFYKRFPNNANNESVQSIMAGIGSNNKKARIFYKVNISGSQAQDTYSNTITYLSVPNF